MDWNADILGKEGSDNVLLIVAEVIDAPEVLCIEQLAKSGPDMLTQISAGKVCLTLSSASA